MARRLSAAGHQLVLWNRSRQATDSVAAETEASIVETPAQAVAQADIAITSLADDAAVESVYLGAEGVAAGVGPGSLVVDTSTIDPETAIRVGDAVDAAGGGFLDCPVSGSVATVDAGALVVMAGGDPSLLDRAKPVLSCVAKQVTHVGSRGAGAACKLAVNGLVHAINVALSETIVLAEKSGIDRAVAYDIFSNGAGGAPFLQYKREAFLNPENTPVAFSLDLVAKDLVLITALGQKVGAPMAQATAELDLVQRAIGDGHGKDDMSALANFLRRSE